MQEALGLSNDEMSAIFDEWNRGKLKSYLIEITRDILAYKDEDGDAVVDLILDSAGQKGTGKWTATNALEMGIPLTLIGEAVFARFLSALKEERVAASRVLSGPGDRFTGDKTSLVDDLCEAVYAAKIISYAQGYMLMRAAAQQYGWTLNYGGVALMWRGGCIIRSAFLGKIGDAYAVTRTAEFAVGAVLRTGGGRSSSRLAAHRGVAVELGIPVPALSSALAFFDGYRRERLPANLTQAQRDYFGATPTSALTARVVSSSTRTGPAPAAR